MLEADNTGSTETREVPGPVDWRETLRHFHLTGEVPPEARAEAQDVPALIPFAFRPGDASGPWLDWPLVLGDGGTEPFATVVSRALAALAERGDEAVIVRDHVARLARAVGREIEGADRAVPLADVLDAALARFSGEFDLSAEAAAALAGEIERLRPELPGDVRLVAMGDAAPLLLWAAAARADRAVRLEAFRAEVKTLVDTLDALLRLDDGHGPGGSSAEALSKAFGGSGAGPIDPAALAGKLPAHRGSRRMPPDRRERVESARATLSRWLDAAPGEPRLVVLHAGPAPCPPEAIGAEAIEDPDGPCAAIGLFDRHAAAMTDVLRAVRVARLEAAGEYVPARHDAAIARFGGQAFTRDEIRLLPAIVVLETGDRLRGAAMASLSTLLRSGRPVDVLVEERDGGLEAGETWDVLSGYHPGLGYVAVAHREAFVLESTLGRPGHLASGLARMASRLRPGVAIVAHRAAAGDVPAWVRLAAAHDGRAVTAFSYDPDAGDTWAERFDLSDNPQPDRPWPVRSLRLTNGSGVAQSIEEACTFAHAAALDPAYRRHFLVVPHDTSSEGQVAIADWLATADDARPSGLPYVWVVGADDGPARAVVTRDLAFACRDRARAWRILQELAGTDNAYARQAAEEARARASEEAAREREALEAKHREELERARAEAAGEAMERLVAVLMDLDAVVPAAPARPAAPAPVAAPAETEAEEAAPDAAPVPAEAEEEEPSFDEPYIDSVLCTSCNDCINLNARLFKYDGNKQAQIADAAAGTFDDLVRAAEKCPARCIHPGKPRDGDPTVTDDLLARAAKFA